MGVVEMHWKVMRAVEVQEKWLGRWMWVDQEKHLEKRRIRPSCSDRPERKEAQASTVAWCRCRRVGPGAGARTHVLLQQGGVVEGGGRHHLHHPHQARGVVGAVVVEECGQHLAQLAR